MAWFVVRDDPNEKGLESSTPPPSLQEHNKINVGDMWTGLKSVFAVPNTWLILIAQGGMVEIMTFTGLWGAPFLKARFGLEPKAAATISSIMIILLGRRKSGIWRLLQIPADGPANDHDGRNGGGGFGFEAKAGFEKRRTQRPVKVADLASCLLRNQDQPGVGDGKAGRSTYRRR